MIRKLLMSLALVTMLMTSNVQAAMTEQEMTDLQDCVVETTGLGLMHDVSLLDIVSEVKLTCGEAMVDMMMEMGSQLNPTTIHHMTLSLVSTTMFFTIKGMMIANEECYKELIDGNNIRVQVQ